MKKRRGLKRYYRNLHKQDVSSYWCEALSDNEAWFNFAHEHFDWPGYGNKSWKEHKEHLNVLFKHFSIIENWLKSIERPIQMFAVIHTDDSEQDALYLHTPNPHTDYPINFLKNGCIIGVNSHNVPMSDYLHDLEKQGYTVLTSPEKTNNDYLGSYVVFKNGVGESLIRGNDNTQQPTE